MGMNWQQFLQGLQDQLPFIIRVVVACICGAAIGYERSVRQKDAGIRTHVIVALGSALMMVVSKYGFFDVIITDSVQIDAGRIAANIVTGISFLGAGVIFVRNASIKGLTTAAGIWATAGVGIAIGSGMYLIGVFSTALMIVLQILLHKFFRGIENPASNEFLIITKDCEDSVEKIRGFISENSLSIQSYDCKRNDDGTLTINMLVRSHGTVDFNKTVDYLLKNDDVIRFDMDDITL